MRLLGIALVGVLLSGCTGGGNDTADGTERDPAAAESSAAHQPLRLQPGRVRAALEDLIVADGMSRERACDSRRTPDCLDGATGFRWYVSQEFGGAALRNARGIAEQSFAVVIRWNDVASLRRWKRSATAASITRYDGEFEIIVDEYAGGYTPGQRGRGAVAAVDEHGWNGHAVAYRGRLAFPNGAVSAPQWVRSWVVSRGDCGLLLVFKANSKQRISPADGAYDALMAELNR